MRTIITGGAGFIGSHLAELLVERGHSVLVIDNLNSGKLENLSSLKDNPDVKFVNADIRNYAEIEYLFNDTDWVFHLAGLADIVPSIENPDLYYAVNATGTLNVLQAAKEHDIKRLVYAASSSCYGIPVEYPTPESSAIQPLYPYALTKYLGEEIVLHWGKVYGVPVISLRLFNVYGPRSRTTGTYGAVFGVFMAQKLKNRPFTVVGDGSQTRDFTFVTDVANAFLRAAESELNLEVFNVGSGQHYSVNYLVNLLGGKVTYLPKRPGEPDCTFADIDKITSKLKWKPEVSFELGVNTMIENIESWKDAPIWDKDTINEATKTWFQFLGDKSNAS
ncbi:SDR family oxidoreductase [Polynucleobacter sp. AP-Melu-500A-A1]|uniref:SDR family oxidoreductase n=1 Tax=Polynucleobacter sp. AP-Melu-500A-A1 TaxID=2576929 RepID=UPI001C0E34B1|nr:SDR family oxidoreductase [Polynucleobacter sp. AP-Melu-500A-A1]MBU3630059.1 SDR family oxidoreductase [Polynucleobacter sp. AP-Melu-500A-A1]